MTHSGLNTQRHQEEISGYLLIPVFLFVLNFILKWVHLDTVQIGGDEPFTLFHAQMTPGQIAEVMKQSNNPPLMEWLLHFWTMIFGDSPASVRFPSLLAGSFTAVLLFHIGWTVRGIGVGLVGAMAYTFSSAHTYYSHEARIYAIFALLAAASTLLLLGLRTHPDPKWRWIWLWVSYVAMIWGHYFGFIVIGFHLFWVVAAKHPEKKKLALRFGMLFVATLLAFSPHILGMLQRLGTATSDHWVGTPSIAGLYNLMAKHGNQPVVAVIMILVNLAGAVFGLRSMFSQKTPLKTGDGLILMFWPGGMLLLFGLGYAIPVFLDRYLIFSIAFWYLTTAMAIDVLPIGKYRHLISLAILIGLAATLNLKPGIKSEWWEVAEFIQTKRQPAEPVLLYPHWTKLGFSYHFAPAIFKDTDHYQTRMDSAMVRGVMPYTPMKDLPFLGSALKVWVISAGDPHADLNPAVQQHLDSAFAPPAMYQDWHGITVKEYRRR